MSLLEIDPYRLFRQLAAGVGLTLVATTGIAAADSFLIDDFNDGDAVGWDQNDFTGIGVFDASSGTYVIRSAGAIQVTDPSVGTIESHWLPSIDVPAFGNGRIRGTVRANTYGTTAGFMLRDNESTESDYGFYGSTSFGTFYIERFQLDANPPQTIIAMADPAVAPFVAGVRYYLEGSVVGDQLRLKAWPVGTHEPNEPTLSVTDDILRLRPGNRISSVIFFDPEPLMAAGVDEVTVSAAFDNVYFSPAHHR